MRRMLCLLSALVMLVALALPVRAEGYPMRLEELGISLTLPEGLAVYTQEGPVDDAYALPPEDAQYLMDFMTETNTYLLAMDLESTYELQVRAEPVAFSDISFLDEDLLEMLTEGIKENLAAAGAQIEDLRIYHSPSTTFLFMRHYLSEMDQYCYQYLTIKNNLGIYVALYSYERPVTEEQAEAVKFVADSLRPDDFPALKIPEVPLSPSFLYTEPESGATILVPRGWIQEDLSQEREYADAKFCYSQDRSKIVIFTAVDMIAEMPALLKPIYSRIDMSESLYEEDIAEEYGVDPAQITTLYLNGQKWFRVNGGLTTEAFGQEITTQTVLLIRFADGWQYHLHYLGTVEDPQYEDLEAMAMSLYAPEPTPTSDLDLTLLAGAFFCCSLMFVALVLLLRWRKARRARRCPRCGRTKDKGASYCISCGQRLS